MRLSLRNTLALIFIPLGIGLAILGWIGPENRWFGPEPHKATELLFHGAAICLEIAIGVALVERLMESSRELEQAKVLAEEILAELAFFTWVWTGETLFIDADAIVAALNSISDLDMMASCTESLAIDLARKAIYMERIHGKLIHQKRNERLSNGLVQLFWLANLRNFDNTLDPEVVEKVRSPLQTPPPVSEGEVAKRVGKAARELFLFLRLSPKEAKVFMPDRSIVAQEFRYEGKRRGIRKGSKAPSFLRASERT